MAIVVDASVALAWVLPDEADLVAERALEVMRGEVPISSAVWPLEVANGIVSAVRRGRLSPVQEEEAVAGLFDLRVRIEGTQLVDALERIRFLAGNYHLTAHDASYLHLAIHHGAPLATLDRQLRWAAAEARVRLIA
jgi:predicted nucleic acid-binding protein